MLRRFTGAAPSPGTPLLGITVPIRYRLGPCHMVFEPSDIGITIGADKARELARARQTQMGIKERINEIGTKTKENGSLVGMGSENVK